MTTETFPFPPEHVGAQDFLSDWERDQHPSMWRDRFLVLQDVLTEVAGEEACLSFDAQRRPERRGWSLYGHAESTSIDWGRVTMVDAGVAMLPVMTGERPSVYGWRES